MRVMIVIWLGCVHAGATLSSSVLAGDAFTGDRAIVGSQCAPASATTRILRSANPSDGAPEWKGGRIGTSWTLSVERTVRTDTGTYLAGHLISPRGGVQQARVFVIASEWSCRQEDRCVRPSTICPSRIFIDPATLPRTDTPMQPGSIQTNRGEVLYSRADPAIQTLLTPQCEEEAANCETDAEGYCKIPMIDPRLSAEMSNPPAPPPPSSVYVPVPVPRPRIIEQQKVIEAAPPAPAPAP
jgi:hypothetical protein